MRLTVRVSLLVALICTSLVALPLFAADQTKEAAAIHEAMKQFVKSSTINGTYYLYDAVEGKLLALKFAGLHEGVASEGDFRASCADFTDQFGRKLDVDFVVVAADNGYIVTEAILHKVDGSKRPYSLKIETPK